MSNQGGRVGIALRYRFLIIHKSNLLIEGRGRLSYQGSKIKYKLCMSCRVVAILGVHVLVDKEILDSLPWLHLQPSPTFEDSIDAKAERHQVSPPCLPRSNHITYILHMCPDPSAQGKSGRRPAYLFTILERCSCFIYAIFYLRRCLALLGHKQRSAKRTIGAYSGLQHLGQASERGARTRSVVSALHTPPSHHCAVR